MRRVVRSRTYVAQLKSFIEQGTEAFGAGVAARTLAPIDHTLYSLLEMLRVFAGRVHRIINPTREAACGDHRGCAR